MDLAELQANPQSLLNQVYLQEIGQNESRINLWKQYKERHEQIILGVQRLVSELSVSCLVPIGKRALMKGKLVHTNEILVCIGDGYFVKYSAQQAIALCQRRIKRSEEILKKLKQERKFLQERQTLPLNCGAFEKSEHCKDIVEVWDEQKLQNWKNEHRKNEKEYRQKLVKSKNPNDQTVKDEIIDDEFFKRLDELELEEELAAELNRLEDLQKNNNKEIKNLNANENKNDDGDIADNDDDEDDEDEDDEDDEDEEDDEDDEDEDDEDDDDDDSNSKNESEEKVDGEKKQSEMKNMEKINDHENQEKVNLSATKSHDTINNAVEEIKKKAEIKNISSSSNASVGSSKVNKISGKFEVSIIKEDDVGKTITQLHTEKHKKQIVQSTVLDNSKLLKKEKHLRKSKNSGRRVSFADPHFVEVEPPSTNQNDELQNVESSGKNKKDDLTSNSDDEDIKIEFRHSQTESEKLDEAKNVNDINNPSDIYNVFSRPKSILKISSNVNYVYKNVPLIEDTLREESAEEENDAVAKSTYITVVQDVQERQIDSTTAKPSDTSDKSRPISRFKLERANKKK